MSASDYREFVNSEGFDYYFLYVSGKSLIVFDCLLNKLLIIFAL
jgi:hypothetical protein